MKKIVFILLFAIAFSAYSQEYKFGIIKNITVTQGVVSLYIDEVDVIYDPVSERDVVVNRKKDIDLYKFDHKTQIKDCLYNRIHPSNIINYKKDLVNNEQFVLFTVDLHHKIKELNINCYN